MAVKTTLFALLLAAAFPGAGFCAGPEPSPQDAQAGELSSVKDKLRTSLFFRGELADKILEAGLAERFVDLAGLETNAAARGALLGWIKKDPAKAAEVYLSMKAGGGRLHDGIETREQSWEFDPGFIAAIKALNDAAGRASVSRETLELAARRLYEGEQAETGAPEVRGGGAAAGGTGFFSIDYAAYRLNRAGLERELSQAGEWLDSARGAALPLEVEGPYTAAFSLYRDFLVAASALKGREAVTGQESRRLEDLRAKLRAALAALALRSRLSVLAEAAASLKKNGAEPGAAELLDRVSRLKEELEVSAAAVEAGGVALGGLGRLVNAAERRFAALYLVYSAYDGLLGLKARAARPGFSCFYDYAFYRYLAAFFPGTPYPRARAELAAAAGALDAALLKAGAGELQEAMRGLEAGRVEAAAATVRSASGFNRAAQFFSWGLFFRPVEYKVSVRGGAAVFRPESTFYIFFSRSIISRSLL